MKEDNDIKETAEEVFGENGGGIGNNGEEPSPEAKASTTIRAYYKGFSVLFTKRNMKGKLSVNGVQEFVEDLVSRGFNPSWVKETKPQPEAPKSTEISKDDPKHLTREHCLIHNIKMDYYEKEGKSWYSHSKDDEKKIWCSGNGWKE